MKKHSALGDKWRCLLSGISIGAVRKTPVFDVKSKVILVSAGVEK